MRDDDDDGFSLSGKEPRIKRYLKDSKRYLISINYLLKLIRIFK